LTEGLSPLAIATKACTSFSGLGMEPIFPLTSGIVRKLFLRQSRAWYGGYFSTSLGRGVEAIIPRASSLICVFLSVLLLSAFS